MGENGNKKPSAGPLISILCLLYLPLVYSGIYDVYVADVDMVDYVNVYHREIGLIRRRNSVVITRPRTTAINEITIACAVSYTHLTLPTNREV